MILKIKNENRQKEGIPAIIGHQGPIDDDIRNYYQEEDEI